MLFELGATARQHVAGDADLYRNLLLRQVPHQFWIVDRVQAVTYAIGLQFTQSSPD